MTPEQNRKRFPKTNREFFRLVIKSTLLYGAAVFVVFLLARLFWAYTRLRSDDVLRYLALSAVAGLGLTLWRLRWMKWRDSRG
jgi:O-antigen/teichoic acid export membrane protein